MARSASIEVEKPYHQVLQTLSEGSVARSFDPYLDIDWDSPEFAIDPHDPRWVLSSVSDPSGRRSGTRISRWSVESPWECGVRRT